jgi:hypothetical protein
VNPKSGISLDSVKFISLTQAKTRSSDFVKLQRIGLITVAVMVTTVAGPMAAVSGENPSSAWPFLGRWDLTLKAPDHDYPSWLELEEEGGQLKAQMVGRWGNARPLPKAVLSDGQLTFVSPKEEEDSKTDLVFQGKLTGKTLSGTVNGPDGKTWQWVGVKAPALLKTGAPAWGEPVRLFNGKDLTGWTMSGSGPQVWSVHDGTIVTPGHGSELVSNAKFQDFKLHIEFNCGTDSNSGVYLRGRYEVQIETESQAEPPSHHTGGVYGFLAPSPELPRSPDVWQTFDITLIGRRVTVVQNGTTIIDNQEIPGITGGAVDSHEAAPGPIYLQGSEKGHVAFRNIVITPAK